MDIMRRNVGFVDWAPHISVEVDDRHYTRDICTVELDPQRFKDNILGNVVDLSAFGLNTHMNVYLVSSNKNNLQETNSLPTNSTPCSGPLVPIRPG